MSRNYRALAVLVVTGFVLATGLYSMVTPLWEAPDEVGHFAFVQHLLRTGRLPELQLGVTNHAHHPPLYYLIAGLAAIPADLEDTTGTFRTNPSFGWGAGDEINISLHHTAETFPYRGLSLAVHLARAVSIMMGAGTILLIMALGWLIFPERREIGLLAAALVAFNPQFLFIHGSVNNDALLTLATTGVLWQTVRMEEKTGRLGQWLLLGLWVAVALLAKVSSVVVVAVAITFLALNAWRRQEWRPFVRGALVAGLLVIILSGWWFGRNQIRYGDPIGWRIFAQNDAGNFRVDPLTLADVGAFFRVQFRSFWGVFGWMNVPAPTWAYVLFAILIVAGLAGLVMFVLRARRRRWAGAPWRELALLAAALLAQEAYLLWAITRFNASWYQGRYLFPVVASIGILLALGLFTLVRPLPGSWRPVLLGGLALFMAGTALWMPLKVIGPAYESPALPKRSLWFLPNRAEINFGEQIVLKGYRVESDPAGSSLELTLTWQAQKRPDFDYSAFVHLVDGSGQIVAQDDGPPGERAGYWPTAWRAEDVIRDRRTLPLPPDAPGPLTVRVGLYNWSDGRRLPAVSAAGPLGDAFVIQLEGS